MSNPLSIRRLALASASHPWRTIAAWIATAVLAIVAVVALLGDSLSSDNHPTDTRESQRAADLIERLFPAGSAAAASDVIVVRSERYTVGSPEFRTVVTRLAGDVRREPDIASVHTAAVSQDRHAMLVSIDVTD